ncbi:MAG: hypothetical protein J5585_03470 [Clostridia bacterium]|nr:hypothetical protein [Clostridia bacterium]
MKKLLTVAVLALTAAALTFAQSCGRSEPEETAKETVALPDHVTADYDTEWAYAGMDRQIPSDDGDFAVTGSGFVYRGGWLGVDGDGYFDLACLREPGSEESFTFCFDAYTEGDGSLRIGLWLYSVDSLPGDGSGGVWLSYSDGQIADNGESHTVPKGAASVRVQMDAPGQRLRVYVNGDLVIDRACAPENGGGAVKIISGKGPAFISNAAFRMGI